MRRAAALAAFLCATAARADGFAWSGALGGGGSRSDSWSTGGPRVYAPAWDWYADLGLSGTPFRPGLLQFLATGQYRSLWSGYANGSTTTRGLGYGLNVGLLSDSLLPISLAASRTRSVFTTEAEVKSTGDTLTATESGTVVLRKSGLPTLRLQLTRSDLDNQSFGGDRTQAGSTVLSLSAAHSTPRQEFSASYDTGWSDGSWAETNYRSHAVQAQASTAISDALRFRLSERYYLRLPTVDALSNPRYDDNNFGAGLQYRPGEKLSSSLDYSYRHLTVSAPAAPSLEQIAHAVRESTSYRIGEVTLSGNADLHETKETRDGQSRSGDSATAGGGLAARYVVRPGLELTFGGGGSAGVARPLGEDAQLAWSALAAAGISVSGEQARANANWSGSYQRNSSGLAGWSLVQQVNVTADALVSSVLLRAALLASGSRREDPLLGTFLSRSASLSLGVLWKNYGVNASAGQSDGVSGALAQPGVADGLFLPANFNTSVRFATVSTGFAIPRTRLMLSLLARTLSTESPDRPIRHEHGGSLTASWSIGAVTLSLEDRFSTGGSAGAWQSGNFAVVRLVRSFGSTL